MAVSSLVDGIKEGHLVFSLLTSRVFHLFVAQPFPLTFYYYFQDISYFSAIIKQSNEAATGMTQFKLASSKTANLKMKNQKPDS